MTTTGQGPWLDLLIAVFLLSTQVLTRAAPTNDVTFSEDVVPQGPQSHQQDALMLLKEVGPANQNPQYASPEAIGEPVREIEVSEEELKKLFDPRKLRQRFSVLEKDMKYIYLAFLNSDQGDTQLNAKNQRLAHATPVSHVQKRKLDQEALERNERGIIKFTKKASVQVTGNAQNERRRRDVYKKVGKLLDFVGPTGIRSLAVPISLFNFLGYLPIRVPGVPYHIDPGAPEYVPYIPVNEFAFEYGHEGHYEY